MGNLLATYDGIVGLVLLLPGLTSYTGPAWAYTDFYFALGAGYFIIEFLKDMGWLGFGRWPYTWLMSLLSTTAFGVSGPIFADSYYQIYVDYDHNGDFTKSIADRDFMQKFLLATAVLIKQVMDPQSFTFFKAFGMFGYRVYEYYVVFTAGNLDIYAGSMQLLAYLMYCYMLNAIYSADKLMNG